MPTATFPEINAAGKGQLYARFVTTMGNIVVRLEEERAPKTVKNFVGLATGEIEWTHPATGEKTNKPLYDGVVFHRIIPGFVVQGGDPTGTGSGGPGYRFEDELPPPGRYEIGSLAMANAGPDTNGSQFFIISGPNGTRLPPSYSLFGKAVAGLEVVAAIEAVGSPSGTPSERVTIDSVVISEAD